MRRFAQGRFWKVYGVLAALALFVAFGLYRAADVDGDDLAVSYVGCRLIADGHMDHLYSHDPQDFAAVGPDQAWQDAAEAGEFDSFLHPYVQTPLWAYSLQPLCTRTKFHGFFWVFAVLSMLSFAACIWLVARFWTPDLLNPLAIGAVLLCLAYTEAFRYATDLMQTHVLFLLLTLSALILAERRRPGAAGLLLACAAAVKLTPGVLVLYWVITRRWKAAGSMVLWSCALWALTILTTGRATADAYLADVHRVSRVLLLSLNNQSFAAWWMQRFYPAEAIHHFQILPLPDTTRLSSLAMMIGCVVLGGILDRHRTHGVPADRAPLGAMIGLLAATIFAPISWTHYAIVLIAPLMVLVHEIRLNRSYWLASVAVLILLLNFRPFATEVLDGVIDPLSVVRGQFFSEVLCLGALGFVGWKREHGISPHTDHA